MLHALARTALAVAAALASTLPVATAQTQPSTHDWPNRPVRIIIPLAAGGGGDVFTRLLAEEMQKTFGQPFVVENRTGGGLNIGARACAEAAPDGYTLCVMSSEPVVYNQFLYKTLPFNPEKDFEPISNLFFNVLMLVSNAKLGVKSIPELVELSKQKPGTLSYGTFSFPLVHFMEQLKKKTGADFVRVPFRGGGEVVNAVMSGTTPVAFLGLSNMIAQVQSGAFVGLAVNANARTPLAPDVPTLKEAAGEDYPATWFGLFGPAGTPQAIVRKVHAEVVRITANPTFRQRHFVERAVEYAVGPTEEFARFIVQNRDFARRIAAEGGVKPQ